MPATVTRIYVNHTSVDYMNIYILLIGQTASTRSIIPVIYLV